MRGPPGRTTMMIMTMIVTIVKTKIAKKKKQQTQTYNNHNNNYIFCGKSLHLTPLLRASCHGQKIRKEKRGRK
jgi:hypothetical protein